MLYFYGILETKIAYSLAIINRDFDYGRRSKFILYSRTYVWDVAPTPELFNKYIYGLMHYIKDNTDIRSEYEIIEITNTYFVMKHRRRDITKKVLFEDQYGWFEDGTMDEFIYGDDLENRGSLSNFLGKSVEIIFYSSIISHPDVKLPSHPQWVVDAPNNEEPPIFGEALLNEWRAQGILI